MSKAIGESAERIASNYLTKLGFKILSRNWKNRWCEIDIVASKDKRIHFVEVKYRKNVAYGSGLDYITKAKAKQMQFAALQWVTENDWQGDYQLDVIAIDGDLTNPQVSYVPDALRF